MLDVGTPRCEATISPELVRLVYGPTPGPATGPTTGPPPYPVSGPLTGPLTGPLMGGDDRPCAPDAPDTGVPPGPRSLPVGSDDAERSGWPEVALRVDGQRPVRFRGLLLCTSTSVALLDTGAALAQVVQCVRLYLSADLHVIAHATRHLDGMIKALPVRRCTRVLLPDDIGHLLSGIGPPLWLDMAGGILAHPSLTATHRTMHMPGLAHT